MSGLDRALANTSQGGLSTDPCCHWISFELHSTFPNQLYIDIKAKFMIKTEKPKVLEFHCLNTWWQKYSTADFFPLIVVFQYFCKSEK